MHKKSFTVVKKKGRSPKNKISFIASTESQDRYGDVINQKGWSLASYDRNPVVLFNHQANSLPIGKGSVKVQDGQLMIDVEFDKDDELAQRIERKARNGFLNAVSVGFNPIESISRSELPKDHPAYSIRGGQFFNKSELLEVSIVTIPANSEATVSAKNMEYTKLTIRDLVVEQLKHILEVEMMDDGKYRIVFAGMKEKEEDMEEEEEERSMEHDKEEDEEKAHYDDDEEEKEKAMEEEDEEEEKDKEKSFLTESERDLFRYIIQS